MNSTEKPDGTKRPIGKPLSPPPVPLARIGRKPGALLTYFKRERVARGVRAAIEQGGYADGQHLSQQRLASQYRVNREVVWHALDALAKDGWVSHTNQRYLVNATHESRQLQRVLNFAERWVRMKGNRQ